MKDIDRDHIIALCLNQYLDIFKKDFNSNQNKEDIINVINKSSLSLFENPVKNIYFEKNKIIIELKMRLFL